MAAPLVARHIQDFSNASRLEPHWGYAERVLPCTNDKGSCEYLDLVYSAHDVGMIYTGAMWLVIIGVLGAWAVGRRVFPSAATSSAAVNSNPAPDGEIQSAGARGASGGIVRARNAVASAARRSLLPESARAIFGHTTRLQVTILALIVAYLTVFSFVGMEYRIWITPVKSVPGLTQTRSTLGPWSDRIGVLAYALTPLSVLLASRESLLSVLTGVPYQSFVFLHRWLGYVIFAQSVLHTIGWCIIEIRLYQPQPDVGAAWIVQTYMIWGLVAMALLLVLFLLSTKWAIRAFGYEFFRKAHYVLAMVYIGACFAHWQALQCFLVPALVIWFVDRAARLVRTALLHYNYLPDGSVGFASAKATVQRFEDAEGGDVVRLDFVHPQRPWAVGQHFFLCFPELSIWQSHPMTPLSAPSTSGPTPGGGRTNPAVGSVHSYVIRAKAGETRKLAQLAAKKLAAGGTDEKGQPLDPKVSVILTGGYGQAVTGDGIAPETNILCVAGGTGVTFVLPVLLELVRSRPVPGRKVELLWAIRHERDMEWVRPELDGAAGGGSDGTACTSTCF
ncbi:ferric reductase [Magnaporthiopsis poae ATCC 64411]|uniref:Ferric reductase n=1 Tax=Magnaporthiopsis poae (strain ATCC 64411 / 73-15) TaxID=644358 RepID=A0A0C4E440_MAGP6|nr:ferric reductase [Magnaporthiopsis poae ATCC 64411]